MTEEKKPVEEESTEDLGHVPESSLSIVDEAKKIRDEILSAKEDLKAENDRKEKLQAESMLASTGGGKDPEPMKRHETPKEYKDRIMRGEHDG